MHDRIIRYLAVSRKALDISDSTTSACLAIPRLEWRDQMILVVADIPDAKDYRACLLRDSPRQASRGETLSASLYYASLVLCSELASPIMKTPWCIRGNAMKLIDLPLLAIIKNSNDICKLRFSTLIKFCNFEKLMKKIPYSLNI